MFNVEVKKVNGTCDSELFKLMASKGDITSLSVSELVNNEFTVKGYAEASVTTDERTVERLYIDTEEFGLIHTSSDTFKKGFKDYVVYTSIMRIVGVKAKLGTCYKCVPVLNKVVETKEASKEYLD